MKEKSIDERIEELKNDELFQAILKDLFNCKIDFYEGLAKYLKIIYDNYGDDFTYKITVFLLSELIHTFNPDKSIDNFIENLKFAILSIEKLS